MDAYLFHEVVVHCDISIRAVESLLQESEKNGYNDSSLQCLSENDKEDWNSEYVDSHDEFRLARKILSGDFPAGGRSSCCRASCVMAHSLFKIRAAGCWAGSDNAERSDI